MEFDRVICLIELFQGLPTSDCNETTSNACSIINSIIACLVMQCEVQLLK